MNQRRAAIRSRALTVGAALTAMFLLTGGVSVSCSGDPALDPSRPSDPSNPSGSSRPASAAMGQWLPNTTYDTCTQAFHDSFFVVGPDGKRYPTWHPPVAVDPANGRECSFGHEHGRDPRASALWAFVRDHYAFDENRNGVIDPTERDISGIPFGYVAEQLIALNAAIGDTDADRFEDHVGYKIAWENSVLRERVINGQVQTFDLFCDVLTVIHQESHAAESLASNLHQLTYAIDCNRGADVSLYSVKLLANVMATFGDPATFVANLPATGFTEIVFGTAQPATSPEGGVELGRVIPTIDNVRNDIFVPITQTSNFSTGLIETWFSAVSLVKQDGTELAAFDPVFTVYSPSRYFDPDAIGSIAQSIDVCYTGLGVAGQFIDDPFRAGSIVRQARGVECSSIAPNGPATAGVARIAFDDPRSPFNGCRREVTFAASTVRNGGGATIWYTDPYGRGARAASFTGGVKQYVSAVDNTTQGVALAAKTFGGDLSNCQAGAGIHAPN
jgi:hypothetical protein